MKTYRKYNETERYNVFFIADEHYFHENILRFHQRPFENVLEMNDALIVANNEVVKSGDSVYHIGDFSFGSVVDTWKLLCKLNGTHYFIEGSHDDTMVRMNRNHKYPINMIGRIEVIRIGSIHCALSHYALEIWPKKHYGAVHFHGHSHGNSCMRKNRADLGVDVIGYNPISIDHAMEIICDINENIKEMDDAIR